MEHPVLLEFKSLTQHAEEPVVGVLQLKNGKGTLADHALTFLRSSLGALLRNVLSMLGQSFDFTRYEFLFLGERSLVFVQIHRQKRAERRAWPLSEISNVKIGESRDKIHFPLTFNAGGESHAYTIQKGMLYDPIDEGTLAHAEDRKKIWAMYEDSMAKLESLGK